MFRVKNLHCCFCVGWEPNTLKYVRSSFKKQTEKTCNSVFSTIHSDIWTPCVTSFGFKYFVTFVDESSHFNSIYLTKDKSEHLFIFMPFFNEIKTNLKNN